MSSENWRTLRVSDVCTKVVSGGTPSTRNPEFYNGSIPWLKTQEVNFNRIYETETKITDAGLKNSSAKWIPANSVIMAMYGATAGKIAINKIPITTNQACCNLIINEKIADYRYVYYNLMSRFQEIASMAVGGAQQNLSAEMIRDLEIPLPPLSIQSRIADVLSNIDDKIELNRQTNATLEAIAQAIFKEWFVDFNYPGATGEMVDSELGPIPNGWSVDNLGGFASVSSGKGLKRTEFTDEGYPILGANGQIGFTNNYLIDNEVILTGRVGTLGTLQLINKKVWISDNVLIITPIEDYYYHYLYLWLKTVDFENFNRGSTQPLITKTDLLNQQLIIPNSKTLAKFDKICRSLFSQIENNKDQSSTLMLIRDSLLPYFFRN